MHKAQRTRTKIFLLSTFILLSFIFLVLGTGVACSKLSIISKLTGIDNNSSIKFVHFSDVHFDSKSKNLKQRLYAHSKDLIEDAFKQVNSMNDVELVIFTGDSINRPSRSDFTKFLKIANELKAPWYLSTGNHEIGISGGLSKQERINLMNQYKEKGLYYDKTFYNGLSKQDRINFIDEYNKNNFKIDKSYYSFIPKPGYLFIAMDGMMDDRISAHGYFPKEELNWLDKQLKNNPDSKAIIFEHFPIIEPSKSENHNTLNADEYMNVLKRHKNVIAVLSGHYHITKIIKSNNIAFISSPSLVEYPNAFRVITVTDKDGKIYIRSEFKETRLKNLQQYSKGRSRSWQLHEGQPEDRNAEIVLDKK